MRKILFSHKRALGDEIMFTAGVRDFKLLFPDISINALGHHPELWQNNPYIDLSIKKGDANVEFYKVGYPMVGNANNTAMHFSVMFLFDMIAAADLHEKLPISLGEFCAAFANGSVGDPSMGDGSKNKDAKEPFIGLRMKYKTMCQNFVRQRGDLHLTPAEKAMNVVKDLYGVEKYWIVAPGGKRDCTAKIWDWRRFQQVIDYFEGKIKFVVIGKSDLFVEKLDNIIDLTDKFNGNIRGLISLVYNAEGGVCGPSALMHMTAAMPPRFSSERKPCVSIFGGREPTAWSWYCNHQVLHTNGAFSCCDNGGCWKARTVPLQKDIQHNKSLCSKTVSDDGRTVQGCMDSITAGDVIRAVSKYYDGDIYTYLKRESSTTSHIGVTIPHSTPSSDDNEKEINLLGNLNTAGGGEQSFLMIAKMLQDNGWKVNVFPWGTMHDNYKNNGVNIIPHAFDAGMSDHMTDGLPLLFYANDCVNGFINSAEELVERSSAVIIGINYVNGSLPKCDWLARSGKLRAIIFQNEEKKDEFARDSIGFGGTSNIVLFGAIDLQHFLEVCPPQHHKDDPFVILKHCMPDYRKYVTDESVNRGEKKHVWQKNFQKETDVKFYGRLLHDTKNTRFEFMQAHKDLVKEFAGEKRMVFHGWDALSVTDFLARGHLYLYRTSDMWRDQYPRGIAEALAAGLPVLCEPRDGPLDRVRYGDTGFYCVDYDEYKESIKKLQRKEKQRHAMGMYAKDWARQNLDPRQWVDVVDEVLA